MDAILPGPVKEVFTKTAEISERTLKAFIPAYIKSLGSAFLKSVMDNVQEAQSNLVDGKADEAANVPPMSARVVGEGAEEGSEVVQYDILVAVVKPVGSEFSRAKHTYAEFETLHSAIKKALATAAGKGKPPVLPASKQLTGEAGHALLSQFLDAACQLIPKDDNLRGFLGFAVDEKMSARQRKIQAAAFRASYIKSCQADGVTPRLKYKKEEEAMAHLIGSIVARETGEQLSTAIAALPLFKEKVLKFANKQVLMIVGKAVDAAWPAARKAAQELIVKIDGIISSRGDDLKAAFAALREKILAAISALVDPLVAKMQGTMSKMMAPVIERLQPAIGQLKALPAPVIASLNQKYVDADIAEADLKAVVESITGPAKTIASIMEPVTKVFDTLAAEATDQPWLGAVAAVIRDFVSLAEGHSGVLGNVVHDYFAEKMMLESDKPPTLDAASVTLQHVNVTRALDIGQVTDHTAASLTTALTTLNMSPAVISKLVAILGMWGQTQVDSIETFRLSLLAAKPADKAALRAQFKVSGTVSSTQARRAYIGYNWAAIKDVILEAALGPPRDSIADQLAGPLEPIMGALPELLADLDLLGFALDVVFMALRAAVEKILDGVKVTLFGEDASDDIGSPSTSAAASGAGVGAGAPTSSAGAVASTTKPTATLESHAAPAHHEAATPAHHEAAAPEHHEAAAEPTRLE
jgi:hypothetical protein